MLAADCVYSATGLAPAWRLMFRCRWPNRRERAKMRQTMTQPLTLLIVDDHQLVRWGIRTFLATQPDIDVLGEAANGEESLQLAAELQPQVVLMDLRMPGMGGVEAIRQIRQQWPQIAVVVLTTYNEDDLMIQGLQAGACGYLLKDCSLETLVQAIRAAARGE